MLELIRVLGTTAPRRVATQALAAVRELGCRRVRADLVDRMGRGTCGVVERPCGRVSERRQRGVRLAIRCRCLSITDAGDRRRRRRGSPSVGQRLGAVARNGRETQLTAARRLTRSTQSSTVVLGGGSDYAVFLNHLGVPSADVAFDGPDPMYHTLFDTHEYVERVADPGFTYTTTLARLMGLAAVRLSGAEVVPIDPAAIASSVRSYLREVRVRVRGASGDASLRGVEAALDELTRAAQSFEDARSSALEAGDPRQVSRAQPPAAAARAVLHRQRRVARTGVVPARADGSGAFLSARCPAGVVGGAGLR